MLRLLPLSVPPAILSATTLSALISVAFVTPVFRLVMSPSVALIAPSMYTFTFWLLLPLFTTTRSALSSSWL